VAARASASVATPAGGSARQTYERRLERHQESVARRRPQILLTGATIIVIGVVLLGVRGTGPFLGGALILLGTMGTLVALFGKPDHRRAWRIGAIGEEHVGAILDTLIASGYHVLHDRRRPGGRENIDHVVIGPTGVFVVETKHYRGRVERRGPELWVNGRQKTAFLDQVERQVTAIRSALGVEDVTGVICIVGADLPRSGLPPMRGIRVIPPEALLHAIQSRPLTLSAEGVVLTSSVAQQRLRNASSRTL
jgi:hypothetical protein